MRVAIAIVPGLLMAIVAAGREQLVQGRRQVLLQTGFELDGADGARAANIENVRYPATYVGRVDDLLEVVRQVVHLAMTGSLEMNLSLVYHSDNRLLKLGLFSFRIVKEVTPAFLGEAF